MAFGGDGGSPRLGALSISVVAGEPDDCLHAFGLDRRSSLVGSGGLGRPKSKRPALVRLWLGRADDHHRLGSRPLPDPVRRADRTNPAGSAPPIRRIVVGMGDSKRPPRRPLSVAEAQAIAEDLRHGRRERIDDVRFPDGFDLQVGTMQGVSFTNCRLQLTLGGGMFRGGVMEDCRFEDVDLDPLSVHRSEMRDSTFERVAFGLEAMGGIDDTLVEGVALSGCRFLDFTFRKTTFRGVRIDRGRMDRVRFGACSFIDLRVASNLKDVDLRGCTFERSDLASSDVVDVTLADWRSSDLRLPGRRTGFFVTPAAVSEVLATHVADLTARFREDVYAGVVMAGFDLIAVSERFFANELGAEPGEATALVDALFPHRVITLGEVRSGAGDAAH